jgi:AcrR family transcriptional regulator
MARASRREMRESTATSDRRNEVITVAARLFSEKGFHGTSMDDIARELGILKGSLYYWIESKEALLSEVLEGSIRQTIEDARDIVAQPLPAPERLRLLIHSHIQSWIRNPHNFNVFLSEYRWLDAKSLASYYEEKDTLEGIYKGLIRQGIEAGEFNASTRDVSIQVNLLFGAMNWFPRWYRTDQWASPEYIAEVLATLVLDGLRTGRPA